MATLSTHVLDTTLGRPAVGVRLTLDGDGGQLAEGVTDTDGRVSDLGGTALAPGTYRVSFDTGAYFTERDVAGFYPEVVVSFTIEGDGHVHVPLLLSPFGYSTYRGS